jgi:hypothetical protein
MFLTETSIIADAGLEWYINNDLQLVRVGFIHIPEAHSSLD